MKNLEKFIKKSGDKKPEMSEEPKEGGMAEAMGDSEGSDVDELLKRLGLGDGKKVTISVSGGEPTTSE